MAAMKRQRSKDEEMMYCLRLNLTNPSHVEIQNKLRNLDTGVHKSINQFIINALNFYIQYADCESKTEKRVTQSEEFLKKEDLSDIVLQIKAEVMKDLILLLRSEGREGKEALTDQTPVKERKQEEIPGEKMDEQETDETLEELASLWSG